MDLKNRSLPELKKFKLRIDNEIQKRTRSSTADLRKRFEQLAREHGLSLAEVMGIANQPAPASSATATAQGKPKRPVAPKYQHPSDRRLTWSGRGSKPRWVQAWLATGGALDALAIAAEKLSGKTKKAPVALVTEPTATTDDLVPATTA